MSRFYFLRKLRSFNVCSKTCAVVCWGSSIGASNTNRLNKLIRKAGPVIGCKQDILEAVVERRTLKNLLSIMDHCCYYKIISQSGINKVILFYFSSMNPQLIHAHTFMKFSMHKYHEQMHKKGPLTQTISPTRSPPFRFSPPFWCISMPRTY